MSHPPPSYSPVMPAEHSSHLADTPPRPWRPGLVRRLPWTGLISLVLALAFAIAAVCVGLRSDGKELDYLTVRSHSVSPAVLLSIFVTLANSLLLYAFTQGATVHWWRTAFEGTTLAQLHSSYHYGDGMTAIFTSATAFNTVALAGIVMPFLLADGPLLQRSLSVEQEVVVSHANRTIPISPSPWILGSTGIISGVSGRWSVEKLAMR